MVAESGEGENPLPFSLTALQPTKRGGVGGGGGGGGVSRLRFPPGPHLRSSRFSRHPRLRQAPTRRFAKNRNLRGLGGCCGEKAPGGVGWFPKAELYIRMKGRVPVFAPEPCIPAA